jgi:acyl-CoA synthetase (AMP-forming)/AMP-acid ligase II
MRLIKGVYYECGGQYRETCRIFGQGLHHCRAHRLIFRQEERAVGWLPIASIGVKPGDRIAIFQVNCFQFAEMVYAIEKVGAIIVTLNFGCEEETKYILNNSEAKVLLLGTGMSR